MDKTRLNLLIIDDEAAIQDSLKFIFRKSYNIFTASSGEEALSRIEKGEFTPQIMIVDQRMPGMSGTEFLGITHANDPDVVSIVITGYSDIDSLIQAVNVGQIYGYSPKPWNANDLTLLVDKAADYYRVSAENYRLIEELRENQQVLEQRVRERTAELEKMNQELKEFAYIASHDLQAPLGTMLTFLGMLKSDYAPQMNKNANEIINQSLNAGNRMKDLIQGLLSYSRAGTQAIKLEQVDCKVILQHTLLNLQQTILDTNASVTYDPLPTLIMDNNQGIQLFQNLIGNGIKFRGEAPPQVHISAQQREKEWLFSVKDNGIGMEAKDAEKVFAIFQRLHGQSKYPGSGIGLSICKKIVERHGGTIWSESELGKGTTFFFTLPLASRSL